MKVVVTNHMTLDGVMQAPMAPEEDRRDGFEHGGWAAANADDVMGKAMGERMAQGAAGGGAMLFGRRTYEHMAAFWPHQPADNPYAKVLNEREKYVASRTLEAPLPWRNSTLLDGDAADAVAALKERPGGNLSVLGSGELLQSLMRRDLVDQWVLLIHPLVLGTGRRLFPDGGAPARFRLTDTITTTTGVVIATYLPA
jgi:dihydrofolate reductase